MLLTRLSSTAALVFLIIATLVGCNSSGIQPTTPQTQGPQPADPVVAQPFVGALPAPSSLLKLLGEGEGQSRSASYISRDLYKTGEEYEPAFPNNKVFLNGDDLQLDSWLPPEECTLEDVAYAGFHFVVPGYDRSAEVLLKWTDEPFLPEDWFIAMANWDTDRWDFYTGNAGNRIATPDMDPYLAIGGNAVVMVLCTGPLDGILDRIRLGGYEPIAMIDATGNRGKVPLDVDFDAVDSLAVEGTITKYEWDLDGDGEFELDTGTTDHVSHTYTENGEVLPGLRVTNSSGATDTDVAYVEAVGGWSHTWGLAEDDVLNDILQTSDGSIFAVGTTERTSGINDDNLLLMRVSPVGILVWAMSWDAGSTDSGARIVEMDNGDLLVAGAVYRAGSFDTLLQRWTRNGEVVWSKWCGGGLFDEITALITDSNNIYIAGDTASTPSGTADVFTAKLDFNGTHFWGYGRDHGAAEHVNDICARRGMDGVMYEVVALCTSWDLDTVETWKLEYFTDGFHASDSDLSVTDFMFEGKAVHHVAGDTAADERYYVAGEVIDDPDRYNGIVCFSATRESQYTYLWWSDGPCYVRDLLYYSDYVLFTGGWIYGTGLPGVLWRQQVADGQVTTVRRWSSSPGTSQIYGLAKSKYSGVLAAGLSDDADGGHWYVDGGNFSSFTAKWTGASGVSGTALTWSWDNDISGTVENITKGFSKFEDEGTGGDDVFMAHNVL